MPYKTLLKVKDNHAGLGPRTEKALRWKKFLSIRTVFSSFSQGYGTAVMIMRQLRKGNFYIPGFRASKVQNSCLPPTFLAPLQTLLYNVLWLQRMLISQLHPCWTQFSLCLTISVAHFVKMSFNNNCLPSCLKQRQPR